MTTDEVRAAVMGGRLCPACRMGYLGRRRIMRLHCPTPYCTLATSRRHVAEHHEEQEGDFYQFWGPRGSREFRRVAVHLGPLLLMPFPASDVVWVWREVTT